MHKLRIRSNIEALECGWDRSNSPRFVESTGVRFRAVMSLRENPATMNASPSPNTRSSSSLCFVNGACVERAEIPGRQRAAKSGRRRRIRTRTSGESGGEGVREDAGAVGESSPANGRRIRPRRPAIQRRPGREGGVRGMDFSPPTLSPTMVATYTRARVTLSLHVGREGAR